MSAAKILLLVGGILIGLVILMAAGIGLLFLVLSEVGIGTENIPEAGGEVSDIQEDLSEARQEAGDNGESTTEIVVNKEGYPVGRNIPGFSFLSPFSFLQGEQNSEGNGFTGQAAGWLFGIASLPVVLDLTAKFVRRRESLRPSLKASLERFTLMNKKYLMPFHTWLSLLAFTLAIVHLLLSSCPNPFPELGLIIAGVLVVTGLIIKLRIAQKLIKGMYKFHASLLVSGLLISVLLAGHILMD